MLVEPKLESSELERYFAQYSKIDKIQNKEKVVFNASANQIFRLLSTVLKVLPQHSHSPIVSSVLFPVLSGLPAIFQVFLGATSFPHLGHFAIFISPKL